MTLRLAVALFCATAAGAAHASGRPATQSRLVLTGANVVDVARGAIIERTTVIISNDRIVEVGGVPDSQVRQIDLQGRYVMPGLIDAHVHFDNFRAVRTALESGVTTARSAGALHYVDAGVRALVRSGALDGPDVIATGYHVRRMLAEEAFQDHPQLAAFMGGVQGVDALRLVTRTIAARGVDWIKVMATERAGVLDADPLRQTFSEEELRAVVREAARRNLPVLAHAHGSEGALAAVRAGVRSIEHGTYTSDAALKLMAARGVFLVPTMEVIKDMSEPAGDYDHPVLQARGREMLPRICDTIARARAAGVSIAAGSDSGYRPTSVGRLSTEVSNLAACGLSAIEALRSATVVNARLLGRSATLGQIRAGFEADLFVIERNPLEQLDTLQRPVIVVSNGRVAVNHVGMMSSR